MAMVDGLFQSTSLSELLLLSTPVPSDDGTPFTTSFTGLPPGTNWINELESAAFQLAPASDLQVGDALRDKLFQNINLIPDDLVARNLQRGREHGIPAYHTLREACGMEPLQEGVTPAEIDAATWDSILTAYGTPFHIDAFTGGLAEEAPGDGLVGPLFACIIRYGVGWVSLV